MQGHSPGRRYGNRIELTKSRTGYPFGAIVRHLLLKLLYQHIPDKSSILTSKRVLSIQQKSDGVTVTCQDGSSYTGDILVGADGVHSVVRKTMQDSIESEKPGATKRDREGPFAEFTCIFGISKKMPAIEAAGKGAFHRTYSKGHSTIVTMGPDGLVYWFFLSKLKKKYVGKDIPTYGEQDIEEAVKPFLNLHVTDKVSCGEIWENRTTANMSCTEESKNENWSSGRIVCLGDAIHKVNKRSSYFHGLADNR